MAETVASCSSRRVCAWCRSGLEVTARRDQRFCSQGCRQFAFRLRRRRATDQANAQPLRFAYADPPYPGLAKRYYGDQDSYAGEVDHAKLVASLSAENYAGWALSTSTKALRDVLALCPPDARVCPWVKPIGAAPATYGPHNTWEPLIVVRGRKLRPGFRDWLSASPARGGGTLPGRKPIAFCAFLFQQLGMLPGDTLDDIFPGTGVVGRAWAEMSREAFARAPSDDASVGAERHVSAEPGRDASSAPRGNASRASLGDASSRYPVDASQQYSGDGKRVARG